MSDIEFGFLIGLLVFGLFVIIRKLTRIENDVIQLRKDSIDLRKVVQATKSLSDSTDELGEAIKRNMPEK